MPESSPPKQLLGIAPLFNVVDVKAAVEYYRNVLGFTCDKLWGEPPSFAMPQRDGLIIMLSQSECAPIRPNGLNDEWDAYIWVLDADALFHEFKSKGAIVHYEPKDQLYYGNREFAVKDRDGYVLVFAHGIEAKRQRTQNKQ